MIFKKAFLKDVKNIFEKQQWPKGVDVTHDWMLASLIKHACWTLYHMFCCHRGTCTTTIHGFFNWIF